MNAVTASPQSNKRWLLGHVCPYWQARIVDDGGGFFEGLSESGEAIASPVKSILNQARLTYVFSHAAMLEGNKSFRRTASHGFDYLQHAGPDTGSFEGWHRSRTAEGGIADSACDTYDQAFVIFAMAWYYKASQHQQALQLAGQAWEFLEQRLADKRGGGFFEEYPETGKLPRRQNPHMHLLEALLAMHAATGEPCWLDRASRIIELFKRIFLDTDTGSLGEYFEADWSVATGAPGLLREPGHQFEWVWLLGQYLRQSNGESRVDSTVLEKYSVQLFKFGSRHGLDPHGPLAGLVFDAVDAAGTPLATSKLLWPQTEYIKACIARFEATQDAAYKLCAAEHMMLMRKHFFRSDGANWVNHVSRDGTHLVRQTPSRVLYHLFLAASELIRVEDS